MPVVNISDENFAKLQDQLKQTIPEEKPAKTPKDMIGKAYFFRTVTYHIVGIVVDVMEDVVGATILCLENASWVAESDRWAKTVLTGSVDQVEPMGKCNVNLTATTDFFPWLHTLDIPQK